MSANELIVSVSGLRGIVGTSLTAEVAVRYASVLGAWFAERESGSGPGQPVSGNPHLVGNSPVAGNPSQAGNPVGGGAAAKPRGGRAKSRPLVVLGRDGRAGGEMIRDSVLAGLTGAGCDVLDLGVAMTPTVGVMVDEYGAAGGVVITASHNPQQWNGIKCLVRDPEEGEVSACAPEASAAAGLAGSFQRGQGRGVAWNGLGRVEVLPGAVVTHVDRVLDRLGSQARAAIRQAGFTVVLDSVNASGGVGGSLLLEELGCTVVAIGNETTGVFPHVPEPIAENLVGLCGLVKDHNADAGFAQDPDADRLAIVDERGVYIGEEYTLVLAAWSALELMGEQASGCVLATNLSTSRMVGDVAAKFGARLERTAVGEANVVAELKRHALSIGGEGNGGVIWPEVTLVRDSLSAMALVLALCARHSKSISQLVAEVNGLSPSGRGYSIVKRKVEVTSRDQAQVIVEQVAQQYAGEKIDRRDGAWVDLASRGAWLHVRASNTEPILRLIAEAPTPQEAQSLVEVGPGGAVGSVGSSVGG